MLSARLKLLREFMNKSQKAVAKELGLEYKRYNHYETGRREPDIATLGTLADYFGVSTDYLLERGVSEEKLDYDDRLSRLLQEPLMQEIYDVLVQLTPETQDIILAQMRAARDSEAAAKKKTCP